jgi:hypothetical protein
MIHPSYVNVKRLLSMPMIDLPEVFDTLIRVCGHTLFMSSYFDNRVQQNPNSKHDFPLIPWCGDIAVMFVGKRKLFVTQGPSEFLIHLAIAQ